MSALTQRILELLPTARTDQSIAQRLGCSREYVRLVRTGVYPKNGQGDNYEYNRPSPHPDMLLVLMLDSHIRRGIPATIREMMSGLCITSTAVVSYHLRKLAAAGLINAPDAGQARAWTLTPAGERKAQELRESGAVLHHFVWRGNGKV